MCHKGAYARSAATTLNGSTSILPKSCWSCIHSRSRGPAKCMSESCCRTNNGAVQYALSQQWLRGFSLRAPTIVLALPVFLHKGPLRADLVMKDRMTSRTLLGMLWELQMPLNNCSGQTSR